MRRSDIRARTPRSLAPSLVTWPGVDGFVPQALLGGGGGGTVWGCIDGGGRRVAVKVAASRYAPRFERERAAQLRVGTPIAAHMFGQRSTGDGRMALIMEWLVGETLANRLQRDRRYPLADVAQLAGQLAERIDAVHRAGVAHRDLKPANIWIEPSGAVRLLDFGLAWIEQPSADHDWIGTRDDIVGTPCYMAPEQTRGEPSGAPADVYSFGAIVFELVTGRPPFVGSDVRIAHASRRPPALSSVVAEAGVIDDVVAACLAKHPGERPRAAGEVAVRLQAALEDCVASTRPATVARRDRAARQMAVVLLGVRSTTLDLQTIASATATCGGMVARARGDGVVIAFPAMAEPTGLARARALADQLGVIGALHVAPLTIHYTARGVCVSGPEIDDPATWWAASSSPATNRPPQIEVAAGNCADDPQRALIGRTRELAAIVECARDARAAGRSAIITIVGEPGSGTSRLLRDAVRAIGYLQPPITIDDAHRRDIAELDRLERQAVSEREVLVAATQPSLYARRPLWADHADVVLRIDLAPLDREHTIALVRSLLAPVEYVAAPVLHAVAELAQGMPADAIEVVRQLRACGAIRQTVNGAWYLAADELGNVSATELAKQLAERTLAQLAPDVRWFARVAAVLANRITAHRLDAMRTALAASIEVDAAIALERLIAARVIAPEDESYAIRSRLCGEAIAHTVSEAERAELHRAALASIADDDLANRARHASGAGDLAGAAAAWQSLAAAHLAAHRDVEAEHAYTAALVPAGEASTSTVRADLLIGRARARTRLQRLDDADADLAAAAHLLTAASDLAEVALERATVADWSERWGDAAAHVAAAEAHYRGRATPKLQLARGRAAFRAGDIARARTELTAAAATGDRETATIANIMLGAALVAAGELAAAQTALDDVIENCAVRGDLLHHCSALNNRMWVWIKRDDLDHAIDDQQAATNLARSLGHPHLERCCTYNLAELLHWRGSTGQALPLAVRSRSLQQRFLGASPLDALLVARIHAAHDDFDHAKRELAWLDDRCGPLDGASAMQRTLIELVVSPRYEGAAWQRVVAAARATNVLYELHESLWFALRCAARVGDREAVQRWRDEAAALAGDRTLWRTRFAEAAGEGEWS